MGTIVQNRRLAMILSAIGPVFGFLLYFLVFHDIIGAIQIALILFIGLTSMVYSMWICCGVLLSFAVVFILWGLNPAYISSLVVYAVTYLYLVGLRGVKRRNLIILTLVSFLGILIGVYVLTQAQDINWQSITSFKAQEVVIIGNHTFKSYVNFTKPDYISRADYWPNGKFIQKIVINGNIEKVITTNGTFTFNVTWTNTDAIDPFALVILNLEQFNISKRGDLRVLTPKTRTLPHYKIWVNSRGLPKEIIIEGASRDTIVVKYKKLTMKNNG
ncbi:hypothetical protein [Thermococcus sp.]|uniref:hypothetical protein n=1 Tax=Thermococcus sp. TaxID=35749 RepID=UPI0026196115|nr:hypothetical protein [Thermococcus sp.]